jgi:hypothetical protein
MVNNGGEQMSIPIYDHTSLFAELREAIIQAHAFGVSHEDICRVLAEIVGGYSADIIPDPKEARSGEVRRHERRHERCPTIEASKTMVISDGPNEFDRAGIGANLTNYEKRTHLVDLKREHLIDQVCTQEILPPER